jgi:glyoxylase-like metal-dependent hydrolase (beta-lactamase superfamily II)
MSVRPSFPNSAFVKAPERAVLRGGSWASVALTVRYGLFEHPIGGRCLIDTGYTARVTTGKRSLPLSAYAGILRPKLTREALPGHAPDVDTILLTHLHADHVSALLDYPDAKIFANGEGVDHFLGASGFGRTRHGVFKELLPEDLGARVVRLEGLPEIDAPLRLGIGHDVFGDGSVLAVPLPGHMRGHMGFVWPELDPPLLYAADAQWLHKAVLENRMPGAPARWTMDDPRAALETNERIAAFARAGGEVVYCHDPEAGG